MNIPTHVLLAALLLTVPAVAIAEPQAENGARIREFEAHLAIAADQVAQLQKTIQDLTAALAQLKDSQPQEMAVGDSPGSTAMRTIPQTTITKPGADDDGATSPPPSLPPRAQEETSAETYVDRILVPDLGHDDRATELSPQPELFVQARYHALPISEADEEDFDSNFSLNRMELRWAGKVSDKVGMGYEIQFHPAPKGAAVELINDAYVEYYPSEALTLKAGQFVKPFGFDIQHSSSARESPERGIFAGYFFPGQRDRGLMLAAKLDSVSHWTRGMSVYAGVFNGNRFFNDNNRQLNYNFRVRKVLQTVPVAFGVSVQIGTQLLPPGVTGTNRENVYGADLQFVVGRLGVRAEYAEGNMPSTLLGLEPEFAPAFRPGAHSAGGTVFGNFMLTARDNIYGRYDQFNNDPVSGRDVRAFNLGYLRDIGTSSRIGIDYQFKNDVSFNDDALNTGFHIIWNVVW